MNKKKKAKCFFLNPLNIFVILPDIRIDRNTAANSTYHNDRSAKSGKYIAIFLLVIMFLKTIYKIKKMIY